MKGTRWSRQEIDLLDSLIGDLPFPVLVEAYNRQAKSRGWVSRTSAAIGGRIIRNGQRMRASQGEHTTTCGAAALLGCSCARVEAWTRREHVEKVLQPLWVGGIRYIKRSAWRSLAHRYPEVMGGFSADALYSLLEDRDLAERVAHVCPYKLNDQSVQCVETGHVYSSCREAAAEHHVTAQAISRAIREGRPVAVIERTFVRLRLTH